MLCAGANGETFVPATMCPQHVFQGLYEDTPGKNSEVTWAGRIGSV